MQRSDKWTSPLLATFFVISGAELELNVFADIAIVGIGVVYILFRCLGKYTGTLVSAKATKCEPQICKYLGITLFPQAGVALGMCALAMELGADGNLIRNITLFAVLIYELFGPLMTRQALMSAGEIKPIEQHIKDDKLTGVAGRIITAKNARNGAMSSNFETTYDAKQGTSLVLTLDKTIQYYLEKGLSQAVKDNDAASAYGIVMDVNTGAVLAMATMPDYDLNNPAVITDKATLKELKKIKDKEAYAKAYNEKVYMMWRNKVVSDTYEPGSVFKIFTAAAGLEEGVVSLDSTHNCTGAIQVADNRIHCHKREGHGVQTLTQGLVNSCNPFFITIGQKLGTEKFYKYFEAFGFTETTKVDLPAEANPVGGVTYHKKEDMGISQLSSSAFGQTFQVSAIQMITAVSAVANGGKLMEPYVVAKQIDHEGNTVYEKSPTVKRQVISESTANAVLGMMEKVVDGGTGRNAYIPGYRVAGKTGTTTADFDRWFIGYTPYFVGGVWCYSQGSMLLVMYAPCIIFQIV